MALGKSFLRLKFVSHLGFGAPMPDLIQILFGCGGDDYEFPSLLQFVATAQGTHDGTPSTLIVTQMGLFANPGGGATADGFPVENVVIVP